MSHPDPLFDPENSYEDDNVDYNYDDHDDFYGDDLDADEMIDQWDDNYDDSMDGDHDSAMSSCGWGTDEDYGYYGDDREDFHADEAVGYVDYDEDGPYDD
jgi:hypothetical protein